MDDDSSDGTSRVTERGLDLPVMAPCPASAVHDKDSEPTKKRKTTYYMRRDEIQSLQDELSTLKTELQQYAQRTPRVPPTALPNALAANAFLSLHAEHNSLTIAGMQSMASAYTLAMIQASGVAPLRSFIHLPVDLEARHAALSAIHEYKLTLAARFMAERTRHLDLRVAHRHIDQFELPGGEAAATTFFITHFTSGHSLRQVYDALMFFVVHQDTSVSDELGILTVRESDEMENLAFGQTRLVSSLPCGLEVEGNIASFAKCVDATADSPAYAVSAMDFVDQDDLHPYRPDVCLRKELTAALTLHEVPSLTGGPPTIAMVRWSYVRIPAPTFSLSEEAERAVAKDMLQWCDVLPKIVNAQLATMTPVS